MSTHTLKDARFRTIGYIETASDGRQTGKDERFRTVGYYNPQSDTTQDARFRTVGHGNLLASLITNC
jgi:hypothetical protein